MSLPEREALQNKIRHRLKLLETARDGLDKGKTPHSMPFLAKLDLEGAFSLRTAPTSPTEANQGDNPAIGREGSHKGPASSSTISTATTIAPSTTALPRLSSNNDANNTDLNDSTGETPHNKSNLPGQDSSSTIATPSHPTSSQDQQRQHPPTTGTGVEHPWKLQPTELKYLLDENTKVLRNMLGAVERHVADRFEKDRRRTAERWAVAEEIAEAATEKAVGSRRDGREHLPVDWSRVLLDEGGGDEGEGKMVEWGWDAEGAVEEKHAKETEKGGKWKRGILGPSALSRGLEATTPDDWLWEEAKREVAEITALGYAYRKDGVGRRVHRL